jgi:ABC-type transport system involved in multi-copper enzyme maturation permease subunit
MKALTSIAKNLKLLFRSKETAYTILFGPLLIILIVSFAFLGSSDEYTIRVGVQGEQGLLDRTVAALNGGGYLVSVYADNESCIDAVREGTVHACLLFHPSEEGEQVPVTFHVDSSRMNAVYKIVDDLSGVIDVQADAIRRQLAQSAQLRMEGAAQIVDESLERTDRLRERFDAIASELDAARGSLGQIPTISRNVTDLRQIKGYQQGFAQQTRIVADETLPAIERAMRLLSDFKAECSDCPEGLLSDVEKLEDDVDDVEHAVYQITQDQLPRQLEEAQLLLTYAIEDLAVVQSTIDNASSAGAVVGKSATSAFDAIDDGRAQLAQVSARLRYTSDFLRGDTTETDMAAAPISTSVVSVTATQDRLHFAYPYLLVLVIMFMGLLLASTLIVTDKTSSAAFRNFTTPVRDGYHTITAFCTAFIVLIAEVLVILLLSTIFVAQPLLLNFSTTIVLVCIAIATFTFLGMIVGYLSRTNEAAMIASISVGSIFLFVSNVIVPIEGMARIVQRLSAINPYIVLSELIKKSMLYGVSTEQIARQLLVLLAFLVVLAALTVWIQRSIRARYFRQEQVLAAHVPAPLQLGGRLVHNEVDLMDALDAMTRAQFEAIVTEGDNPVSLWAERELRNARLARKLRIRNKERMILILDRHLARHGKRIKRT